MSHTDHHEPLWVQGRYHPDREASHHRDCINYPYRYRWGIPFTAAQPCDIDTNRGKDGRCGWQPPLDQFAWLGRPPAGYFRTAYYKPERQHVRGLLRNAARDWRGFTIDEDGDLYADFDEQWEPDNRQHRHALWGGGWWD